MTKDRALEVLAVYASVNGSGRCTQSEFEEAKKMAIEALESQDRQAIIAGSYLLEGEDNVPDTNVGDTISRQAAIDLFDVPDADGMFTSCGYAMRELKKLPSAQQWIPVSEKMPEDAVEVVRCKDCKYTAKGGNESEFWNICTLRPLVYVPVSDEDYCSRGEKKDDGRNDS